MKLKLAAAVALALVATPALADQVVRGYVKKDGTYVQPYIRSTPDGNKFNNYSTQGNYNPYTGKQGTQNPYAPPPPSNPYRSR